MLWFTYARVSSEEQAKLGFSLPSQIEACRARATALGATQTVDFSDEGVPGDILERPGIEKLREAAAKGGATGLVVYDPDRLARNLSHQLLLTEEFERAGLKIEFVNFDWQDTPEGKLFYSIRGAISEYEKEKIRERTTRGRKQKAKMGLLASHPHTYGYRFDPVTDTLSIVPDQAEVVRTIFSWCAEERIGARSIANRLIAMGVPPARSDRWWPGSVRRILLNSTYVGVHYQMRYDFTGVHKNKYRAYQTKVQIKERPKEEWIPVQVPAIITPELWASVQDYMVNANRIWRSRTRTHHLLTGLTRCALCGKPMSGTSSRGFRYYRCVGYMYRPAGTPTCGQPMRKAAEVEDQVWAEVCRWFDEEGYLRRLVEGEQSGKDAVVQAEAELAETEKALAGLVKERQRIVSLYQKDLLPEADVTSRLEEIKRREADLKKRQEDLRSVAVPSTDDQWLAFDQARKKIRDRLNDLNDEERRGFLHWLVEEITFFPDYVSVWPKRSISTLSNLPKTSEDVS